MRYHLTSTWNRPAYAIGRRKAVDSLAFAVKLLCIGFVYLISISFCLHIASAMQNWAGPLLSNGPAYSTIKKEKSE